MTEPWSISGLQEVVLYTIHIQHWNIHKHIYSRHSGTRMAIMHTKPHSSNAHLINPQDLGNKTVNPLLTVSVAQQGWLHIMQDKKRDVGWLYNSNWPHGAHGLCQPDSKLFYASGALIFHTVSSHDSFFPQRKIAGIKKKDFLWSIGPLCYWIQVTSRGRWGQREYREGGREGEDEDRAQQGVCMLVSLREILACTTRAEKEQVAKQQYNSAQVLVLHPWNF